MNYKFIKITLGTALISYSLFSCNTSSDVTETEILDQKTEENRHSKIEVITEAKEQNPTVFNANLATQEELKTIGLTNELVEKIIENRPFINLNDLNVLLINEENKTELYKNLFVPLNLNTTPEEDFKMIPGVGDKMAHEFEEYRPYKSIKQFRKEIGKYVDNEEITRYENFVFVPVELNSASEEDILALPGLGKKMAHEFDEYRPYKSMNQFRKEIGKYVDDNELKRLERLVYIK